MGMGFVIFMALFIKCFAAHTPSRLVYNYQLTALQG